MRSSSRLFVRTLLIPGFVLLLGLAAIASITVLQDEAHDSADAQAKLARMETDLAALQIAPFQASERTGGSPEMGRRLIDTLKRSIDAALADLLRDSPPPALRGITAPLRANYATYEQIYAIGVRGEYGRAADALAGKANGGTAQIGRLIVQADGTYRRRADTADTRATIGSAIVILLLVAAFGFLYRRAVGARLTAERLVAENARLLAGSRVEALTDALTALPNRRSLTQDLDDAVGLARGGREHVLAMFDLDGFKQYNDTFGHPAGDALLARLGGRLRAADRLPDRRRRVLRARRCRRRRWAVDHHGMRRGAHGDRRGVPCGLLLRAGHSPGRGELGRGCPAAGRSAHV
jgi:hypothetical protein